NRARALRAEAKEKGLGAAAAIIHALRDDSSTVRFTALSLAADLKAREACQPILDMLGRQENADLKSSIAWALGKVGDKKAAGTLIGLLKDNDKVVAEAARAALSELAGGKDYGTNAAAWRAHFEQ
ncbi:MAG TPA: HEAT repeat domain-containing protein, partial [Planctomycetota bacterium]|nr:HEAT repeat domain-containing protein [Planctomycetota bacterium]